MCRTTRNNGPYIMRGGDEQNNHNSDQLISACANGELATVKRLLASGVSPNIIRPHGTPLGAAILYSGFREIVSVLAYAHANLDIQDYNGWSPLFIAAGNDLVEVIQYLCALGANVNAACLSNGWTPLMNSAYFDHTNSTITLLRLGADIKIRSLDGLTAIDIAEVNKRKSTIRIFKQYLELMKMNC